MPALFIGAFLLYTMSTSVIMGWLYNVSNKKLVNPWVMHAMGNTVAPLFLIMHMEKVPQPGYWLWAGLNFFTAIGLTFWFWSNQKDKAIRKYNYIKCHISWSIFKYIVDIKDWSEVFKMKKMFLGGLLFLSGFNGILALVCISVFKPWNYNEISGFAGFLLGSNTLPFFIIYCVLCMIGIVICSFEVYIKKKE